MLLEKINPDNAVEVQHAEFRCLTGKVCQRLAGIKTSQRLVKPCQRDAGIPGTGNCIIALFGIKLRAIRRSPVMYTIYPQRFLLLQE